MFLYFFSYSIIYIQFENKMSLVKFDIIKYGVQAGIGFVSGGGVNFVSFLRPREMKRGAE